MNNINYTIGENLIVEITQLVEFPIDTLMSMCELSDLMNYVLNAIDTLLRNLEIARDNLHNKVTILILIDIQTSYRNNYEQFALKFEI